jgi:hypothetical protein
MMRNSCGLQLSTQSGIVTRLSTMLKTSYFTLNQVIIQPTGKFHYLRTGYSLLLGGIIRILDIQKARGFMDNYDKDTIIEIYAEWLTTSTVTFTRELI